MAPTIPAYRSEEVGMTASRMPRLVVVDDDNLLAEELAGLLTDVGYEVTGVANEARQGIALVDQTHPDVVVMDVRMDGMSGTEAAGVLQRRHPDVPVVLLSAVQRRGDPQGRPGRQRGRLPGERLLGWRAALHCRLGHQAEPGPKGPP